MSKDREVQKEVPSVKSDVTKKTKTKKTLPTIAELNPSNTQFEMVVNYDKIGRELALKRLYEKTLSSLKDKEIYLQNINALRSKVFQKSLNTSSIQIERNAADLGSRQFNEWEAGILKLTYEVMQREISFEEFKNNYAIDRSIDHLIKTYIVQMDTESLFDRISPKFLSALKSNIQKRLAQLTLKSFADQSIKELQQLKADVQKKAFQEVETFIDYIHGPLAQIESSQYELLEQLNVLRADLKKNLANLPAAASRSLQIENSIKETLEKVSKLDVLFDQTNKILKNLDPVGRERLKDEVIGKIKALKNSNDGDLPNSIESGTFENLELIKNETEKVKSLIESLKTNQNKDEARKLENYFNFYLNNIIKMYDDTLFHEFLYEETAARFEIIAKNLAYRLTPRLFNKWQGEVNQLLDNYSRLVT